MGRKERMSPERKELIRLYVNSWGVNVEKTFTLKFFSLGKLCNNKKRIKNDLHKTCESAIKSLTGENMQLQLRKYM